MEGLRQLGGANVKSAPLERRASLKRIAPEWPMTLLFNLVRSLMVTCFWREHGALLNGFPEDQYLDPQAGEVDRAPQRFSSFGANTV